MVDKRYRLKANDSYLGFSSDNLDYLIKQVEFFNSFRRGLKSKPRIIEIKTGRVVYD